MLGKRLDRAEQGGLLVQRLARPRAERRRDAKRRAVGIVEDERRAGRVPRGVAPRLERGADAARGEARCVGLAAHQLFAAELGDRRPGFRRHQERVVLLGRQAGHRLEPVGEVRRPVLHRPFAHRGRDHVGDRRVERSAFLDRVSQRFVDIFGQTCLHHLIGKDIDAEKLTDRRRQPRGSTAGKRPVRDRLDGGITGTRRSHGEFSNCTQRLRSIKPEYRRGSATSIRTKRGRDADPGFAAGSYTGKGRGRT